MRGNTKSLIRVILLSVLVAGMPLTDLCGSQEESQDLESKNRVIPVRISDGKHSASFYMSSGVFNNLNCKAKDKYGALINCHNLTRTFSDGAHDIANNEYDFSAIDTVEKIRKHPMILEYEAMKKRNGKILCHACYFSRNSFGNSLKMVVDKQIKNGFINKKYYLYTKEHVMGLSVSISRNAERVKLGFYDPNDTFRVRWVKIPIQYLSKLSIIFLCFSENPDCSFMGYFIKFKKYYEDEGGEGGKHRMRGSNIS